MSRPGIVVLGIGNLLMGDEGVGVHAVRARARALPADVTRRRRRHGRLPPADYFEHDAHRDDRRDDGRPPPGTVSVLRPRYASDFPRTLTAHDIGLRTSSSRRRWSAASRPVPGHRVHRRGPGDGAHALAAGPGGLPARRGGCPGDCRALRLTAGPPRRGASRRGRLCGANTGACNWHPARTPRPAVPSDAPATLARACDTVAPVPGRSRPARAQAALLFTFLYIAMAVGSFLLAKPIRNGLFLQAFGSANLVYVYVAVPLVLSLLVPVYTAIAARVGHRKVITGSLLFLCANVLVFWWGLRLHPAAGFRPRSTSG